MWQHPFCNIKTATELWLWQHFDELTSWKRLGPGGEFRVKSLWHWSAADKWPMNQFVSWRIYFHLAWRNCIMNDNWNVAKRIGKRVGRIRWIASVTGQLPLACWRLEPCLLRRWVIPDLKEWLDWLDPLFLFSHFWCYPLVCYIFLLDGISERSNRFQNLQVQQQQQVVNAMLQQLPQQQRSQIEQVPQMGVTTSEMKQ